MKYFTKFGKTVLDWRVFILWATALVLNIIFLTPILKSGFLGDDYQHAYIKGFLLENNVSLLTYYYNIATGWLKDVGRFFPLQFYFFWIFYFIKNLYLYKTITLGLIVLNVFLFGHLVKIISRSNLVAILAIAIMPLCFQVRIFHDGILGFYYLQQIIFLYIFLSLILFYYFLKTGKKYLFYISLLFYLFSLLTYETTYLFCILHFFIAYLFSPNNNFRATLKLSSPYFLLAALCTLITLFSRYYFLELPFFVHGNYSQLINSPNISSTHKSYGMGYIPNFDPHLVILTLSKHIFAAFPFSYFSVDPHHLFKNYLAHVVTPKNIFIFLLSSIFLFCLFDSFYRDQAKSNIKPHTGSLFILGALLLILPGIFISLAPRYQNEIFWGVSHMPVYVSYFGAGIILTTFLVTIFHLISRTLNFFSARLFSAATAVIVAILFLINYQNTKTVISALNKDWLYPRTLIEEALQNGLLDNIADISSVRVDHSHPWDSSGFYLMHSGRKINHLGINGNYLAPNSSQIEKTNTSDDNSLYLRYDSKSNDTGYAILGFVKDLHATNQELIGANSSHIYIYIRTPSSDKNNQVLIEGEWSGNNNSEEFYPFQINKAGLITVSSGVGWELLSLQNEKKIIDLKTLKINIENSSPHMSSL